MKRRMPSARMWSAMLHAVYWRDLCNVSVHERRASLMYNRTIGLGNLIQRHWRLWKNSPKVDASPAFESCANPPTEHSHQPINVHMGAYDDEIYAGIEGQCRTMRRCELVLDGVRPWVIC